jgi:hypothetical protein
MKYLIISIFSSFLILSFSCKKEEENNIIRPSINYDEGVYNTDFYKTDSTDVPDIDWGGEEGILSLSQQFFDIKFNDSTGVIIWDKTLELGDYTIVVNAENSAGQTSVNLSLTNEFEGTFVGGFNQDPQSDEITFEDYSLIFEPNGTMTVEFGDLRGSGTWTREDYVVTAVYQYENASSLLSMQFNIIYNETEAFITGYWYEGNQIIETQKEGKILLDIHNE